MKKSLLPILLATSLGCAQTAPPMPNTAAHPAPLPTQPAPPPSPPPQEYVAVDKAEQASVDAAWVDMQIAQLQLQLALQKVLKAHKDLMYDGQVRKFVRIPQAPPPAKK